MKTRKTLLAPRYGLHNRISLRTWLTRRGITPDIDEGPDNTLGVLRRQVQSAGGPVLEILRASDRAAEKEARRQRYDNAFKEQ